MSPYTDEFSFDHPDNKGYGKHKRLFLLSKKHPMFLTLKNQFNNGWKHPGKSLPRIKAIYKILAADKTLKPYHKYRTVVGSSPSRRGQTNNQANEQLLFHGTNRLCGIAEDGTKLRLCHLSKCYLCCVIRNSFDVRKCGTKHKFRRFGTGIYTTSCSSKADDYVSNGSQDTRDRVLLVSRVVVGNPHIRRYNATDMIEPPCGHHSVIGKPGGDLNYEETVVYDNDAIRPAFLIVYGDLPPTTRSKLASLVVKLFHTPLVS